MAEAEKRGRFRRIWMVVMWDLYNVLREEESARAGAISAQNFSSMQTQRSGRGVFRIHSSF